MKESSSQDDFKIKVRLDRSIIYFEYADFKPDSQFPASQKSHSTYILAPVLIGWSAKDCCENKKEHALDYVIVLF